MRNSAVSVDNTRPVTSRDFDGAMVSLDTGISSSS